MRTKVHWLAIAVISLATSIISSTSFAEDMAADKGAKCDGPRIGEYFCFYPFFSTYAAIDEGYRFEDDLVFGEPLVPYVLPRRAEAIVQRETLVRPRLSFVGEIFASANAF